MYYFSLWNTVPFMDHEISYSIWSSHQITHILRRENLFYVTISYSWRNIQLLSSHMCTDLLLSCFPTTIFLRDSCLRCFPIFTHFIRSVVVKALRYKSEGPGIDSRRWCFKFILWQLTFPCVLGSTQPPKMSTRIFLGVKAAGAWEWRHYHLHVLSA